MSVSIITDGHRSYVTENVKRCALIDVSITSLFGVVTIAITRGASVNLRICRQCCYWLRIWLTLHTTTAIWYIPELTLLRTFDTLTTFPHVFVIKKIFGNQNFNKIYNEKHLSRYNCFTVWRNFAEQLVTYDNYGTVYYYYYLFNITFERCCDLVSSCRICLEVTARSWLAGLSLTLILIYHSLPGEYMPLCYFTK